MGIRRRALSRFKVKRKAISLLNCKSDLMQGFVILFDSNKLWYMVNLNRVVYRANLLKYNILIIIFNSFTASTLKTMCHITISR